MDAYRSRNKLREGYHSPGFCAEHIMFHYFQPEVIKLKHTPMYSIWLAPTIVRRGDNTVKRRVLRAQKANLHPLEPSECKNWARTADDWDSMNFHSSLVGGGDLFIN